MSQLRVADLFQLPPLKQARLVCGHESTANVITGVNIIEAPDVADWVQSNDVLLTNLYSMEKLRPLDKFIEKVASKGLSALIVKTGLFVQKVPGEIVEAASRHKLPVIEISRAVLYRDIMLSISEHLLNQRINILERFKEINDYFVNVSLENQGVFRIISSLESFIGNPVVLYDKNFQCLFSTNNSLNRFIAEDRILEERPYFTRPVSFPDLDESSHRQFVFPITVADDMKLYLAVVELTREIEEVQFIAIESAINSLALDFIKQRAVIEVEKHFRSDLISDLLSGRTLAPEDIYRRASLLQWDLRKKYVAVVMALSADTEDSKASPSFKADYVRLQEQVGMITSNLPMQIRDSHLIVLSDAPSRDGKDWQAQLRKRLAGLRTTWRRRDATILKGGIGDVASSIADLSRSYREAVDALNVSRQVRFDNDFVLFSELGIYRMLCQFPVREQLESYMPPSLKRLLHVKPAMRDELLKTLEAFFGTGNNIVETSRQLGVHHKTIVYRLERIETSTGMNFKDADEMLMVQVGLKILTVLGEELKEIR